MQIKTQWDIISHLSEWLSRINPNPASAGKGVEKREPSYIVGEIANWYSCYGKQYGGSSKN